MSENERAPLSRWTDAGRLFLTIGAIYSLFLVIGLGRAASGWEQLGMLCAPGAAFLVGGILCAIGRVRKGRKE